MRKGAMLPAFVAAAIPAVTSAATIQVPDVWVDSANGRHIYVMPRFSLVTREAAYNPSNATDQTRISWWMQLQDMGGNDLFHENTTPCDGSGNPVWANSTSWVAGNPVWACYTGGERAFLLTDFNTDGCFCAIGSGNCPGQCDTFLDYLTQDWMCPFEILAPNTVGQASPVMPNTTYRVRLQATNLDPAVAGVECIISPWVEVTTGWQPPTIASDAVTVLGPTSVGLNGRVVPRYADSAVWWEYGLTSSYGSSTPVQTVAGATGDTHQSVSEVVTGLLAGKLYHYKMHSENAGGHVESADMTFTASYTTPIVTSGTATMMGNSVVFSGTVDPQWMQTHYYVQVGPTDTYGQTITGGAIGAYDGLTNVSVTGAGFVAGQTYHWRMAASSQGGMSAGADGAFTMPLSFAPLVTTGDATDLGGGHATIRGTINSNGGPGLWYVEYGYGPELGHTHFGGGSAGTADTPVWVTVSGLEGDSEVYYRLVGTNGNGTTLGATKTFTTRAAGNYIDFTAFKCRWVEVLHPNLIDGHGHRGLSRQSAASLSFDGTGIRLYSMRDSTLGRMRVTVDGQHARTVSLGTSGSTQYGVPVYTMTGLTSGRHILKVEAPPQGKRKQVHIFVNVAEVLD